MLVYSQSTYVTDHKNRVENYDKILYHCFSITHTEEKEFSDAGVSFISKVHLKWFPQI